LQSAIDFVHIFGKKVNLAINILFSDTELQDALNIIVDTYNMGVDCFIIQDLGLAKLVHDNYPEIEIHASTQMGIHNLEGVKYIEQFGFKRVVLSRETPLEEIRRIKNNTNIEIEYFAQGALCVSFSGNCYLSSYLCNASGNRGKCKQLCRLPYTLEKNGKLIKSGYLLSAKDINMINRLKDLKKAGVDVIKIEGRARRPYYVAATTKEYYNAIHNKPFDLNNLKLAFNRKYTEGYFNGNSSIISDYQNHIGIYVGTIEKVSKGKHFNEIYFSSDRKLYPKSTFKIFDKEKEKNTISAYDLQETSKNKYKITTTQNVNVGNKIHIIIDNNLEKQCLSIEKKVPIKIKLFATINKPIRAEFSVDNKTFNVFGTICETAKSQPVTALELNNNFSKNDLFSPFLEICKLDKIFITKQNLNEFRRSVFEKIYQKITEKHRKNIQKIKITTNYTINKFKDFQIIEKINDKLIENNIIYSPEIYSIDEIKTLQKKCKNLSKSLYLDLPNFALEKDIQLIKNIIYETKISIVANNYYSLLFNTEIVVGAGLNVFNSHTAQIFNKPIITAESDISTKIDYPYMTLRHCPLKTHLSTNCSNCPYSDDITYRMDSGKILKLKRKKLSSCTFYLV